MPLINCSRCGDLFAKKLRDCCDKCIETEKIQAQAVVDFFEYRTTNATIEEVSEITGITMYDLQSLHKNRLLVSVEDRIVFKCKRCSVELPSTGHKSFCPKCLEILKEEFPVDTVIEKTESHESVRQMYVRRSDEDERSSFKKESASKPKFGFKRVSD